MGTTPACPGRDPATRVARAPKKHRPACALDCQKGNDPVQPLHYGMSEICRRYEGRLNQGMEKVRSASRERSGEKSLKTSFQTFLSELRNS
jgi:hypothetical protein